MSSRTLTPRTALIMTLPPLLWAGNAVVGRLMVGSVPPLTLNWLRWSLAALLLLVLGWRVLRDPRAIAARWAYLLPLGLLGVGAYNALQYQALVTTSALNVTLIASTAPVWMLGVGAIFYGVKPLRQQVLGAALCMGGALLVILRGDFASLARFKLVPGDVYVLIAIIAWSFYSWLLVKPPSSMKPPLAPQIEGADGAPRAWSWAEFLLVQTAFGLLGAGAAAGVEQWQGAAPMVWDAKTWAALAYVAIGPSVLAYFCWGYGVARGGPALATAFANLTPVFAAVLSATVLGESPRWFHLSAFALIVTGIGWSARATSSR
jgi:drug/metabolite transporter (DMT)-like permease